MSKQISQNLETAMYTTAAAEAVPKSTRVFCFAHITAA